MSAWFNPSSLFRLEAVFLKFDISCVLAASPKKRCLSPKETKDGVALFDTSFVITSIPLFLATATTVLRFPKSIPKVYSHCIWFIYYKIKKVGYVVDAYHDKIVK